MRLSGAAVSILAIGLIVAACGGDEATPEATAEATPVPAATDAAEGPATEASEAPAAEAAAEPEYSKKAAVTSEDDPEATYALASGRYRMQWSTTDCEQVDLLVQQVDGDFSYPKPSRSSFASATINDLPEGSYKIQQLDPDCTEWSVRIDWMTN